MQWQQELVSIAAPPFGEHRRAEWLAERFRELKLKQVEIDSEGKPRAPQFEGFGFGRQPGGGARGDFRNFDFGSGGFSAESGSIDPDILSELFGAGRTRARSQSTRGEDMSVSVTVPLATIAHGGSIRVALPTGKMLESKRESRSGCVVRATPAIAARRRATSS